MLSEIKDNKKENLLLNSVNRRMLNFSKRIVIVLSAFGFLRSAKIEYRNKRFSIIFNFFAWIFFIILGFWLILAGFICLMEFLKYADPDINVWMAAYLIMFGIIIVITFGKIVTDELNEKQ
ncbi:MAG: hypothetical protein Q7K21_03845 [Elusimicrobiota bacterium]|nr:hypothetical protein [Elusimicrobiota bacterium]